MNDFNTPRRRHSSLFQRMEDQINKISKKLSAAKQHRQHHYSHSRKATHSHPISPLHPSIIDTPEQTVRKYKPTEMNSKQFTKKLHPLGDLTNFSEAPTKAPIRRLRLGPSQFQDLENRQMKKLIEQNKNLEEQLKSMKAICEEQAFKIGYFRAENYQKNSYYQKQNALLRQQQLYLTKLAQGYKLKVQKYKKHTGIDESLELSVSDL